MRSWKDEEARIQSSRVVKETSSLGQRATHHFELELLLMHQAAALGSSPWLLAEQASAAWASYQDRPAFPKRQLELHRNPSAATVGRQHTARPWAPTVAELRTDLLRVTTAATQRTVPFRLRTPLR